MCGICGFIPFNRRLAEEDNRIIDNMNKKLFHRGPDACNTMQFDNVALGFTRLSIIGLDNGMQPITNEDGTVILICNGEIFNYIELKQDLIKRGHVFTTATDVEVLLHLYEEEGMKFLNSLNGQFAFALYDKKKKTLFCCRDQLGILPFFYTTVKDTFIFASEIKAILQHPLAEREPDLVGLDQVFTFAGLISPRTMFKNIHSLENGHYLTVTNEGIKSNTEYWDLEYPEGEMPFQERPEKYYIDKLEELFETSIRLRLRADVPSGLYLSGGLDSSMIAMKVNQLFPGAGKQAFSIDFAESELSESFYQQLVARESRSRLNQKKFFFSDIADRLRQSVYHSECPIKETYNTASYSLSDSVRSNGLKVILSGEGADEFFAGYVGYRFDKMRAMNLVRNLVSAAEENLRTELWGDKTFFYERNFLEFDQVKKGLYAEALSDSFHEINCLNYPVINKNRLANRDVLNKRAYIDYKIRLVDHLVSDHGDRMAMANSVEVRYPFLDKDLVAFSTHVPSELKLNGFTEKYILKKMAGRFMPDAVVNREKFHFIAPGSPFLMRNNIEYIQDILSYSTIKRQGYFNADQLEDLKKLYSEDGFTVNAPFEPDLLIVIITFGILLDTYFN